MKKERNMKKGKSFLLCPSYFLNVFFMLWNAHVAQHHIMHYKKSCSESRKSVTSQRNISYDKFHFLWMPITFIFSLDLY